MPVKVTAVANCDDVVVFWRIDAAIDGCWGFAIEREQKLADGTVVRKPLDNRVGFVKDAPKSGDKRPSTDWPFQRFSWADHEVGTGDRVRYRVIPMVHDGVTLQQLLAQRSAWTPWLTVSSATANGASVCFNRGLVISQFMARYLEALRVELGLQTLKQALTKFKQTLDDHEKPIRVFLSGVLRSDLLRLLEDARTRNQHVYGALYELEDGELVDALAAFGTRGHVVLANGSITKRSGETSEEARKRDQNKEARALLKARGVEVHDRMISPGALGHNKFLVVAKKTGQTATPGAVWTGSTNWTATGLCTQTNNGLLVKNGAFAAVYFAQWERLRDAKSTFPQALTSSNSSPKTVTIGASTADIWFSRTSQKADLKAIDAVVNGARDAVLFLMFQPGGAATLGSIRKRIADPGDLYIKGVVSTLPAAESVTERAVDVSIMGDNRRRRMNLDVIQPQGVKTPFASWAATITRNEFLLSEGGVLGYAIVHSKVIVVDPFTNPVVITGSHNFSNSASTQNDENFVIVRGNRSLALEYAVHVLTIYKHYRWQAYVAEMRRQERPPFSNLLETDKWQAGHLRGASKREMDFWVR